jgi:hypothetical protein
LEVISSLGWQIFNSRNEKCSANALIRLVKGYDEYITQGTYTCPVFDELMKTKLGKLLFQ